MSSVERLKEKEKLFEEILAITHRQSEVLNNAGQDDEETIRQLNDLIEKRRELIDKITEIDNSREIKLDSDGAAQVQKNIDTILEKIQRLDAENNTLAKEILSRLKKQMKSLQDGKRTFGSYAKKPRQVEGFFVDNKK